MPKYALCAELKDGCRDQYIEMHHHATVTQRLRDINRRAGVTKEEVRPLTGHCLATAAEPVCCCLRLP